MIDNQKFSVRLANGKEQTFASAAAMAKWIQEQREFDYVRNFDRRNGHSQRQRRKQAAKPKVQLRAGERPLDRFARRSSGTPKPSAN